ncbi:DNA-binding protein [beta proteobacterium AAP121]|nr:DNA-binding protein [beta proteobacterium AAP65]KPG00962.1 DNA-binding protein [beta proteobacterium AAP121]
MPLDERIATRVRTLRAAAGLSLEALAQRSGVSRSMISLIERSESSATAVVLEKLATALGVTLASLFDAPIGRGTPPGPLARAAAQPPWQDPGSAYVRRNVSPAGWPAPFQIVDVHFPPRARVAYETAARTPPVHQQVWVIEGRIDITVGTAQHRLDAGDCLALQLDQPVAFHNPSRRPARYAVVLGTPGGAA